MPPLAGSGRRHERRSPVARVARARLPARPRRPPTRPYTTNPTPLCRPCLPQAQPRGLRATRALTEESSASGSGAAPADGGDEALYPDDLFTPEELANGAIVLHVIGVLYLFVALAVVCDEFFVPALEVITERTGVSDDVAGATFMAAGGSAPELFTSFIGVFIASSQVGFGTIVGSAVFNVLFVIGMCAVFSKELLELTWWPLFRDSMYYSLSLGVLVAFFWDNFIEVWEALLLLVMYGGYVVFMKYNVQCYELITGDKASAVVEEVELSRHPSSALNVNLMRVPATFRAGVLHLMLRETDPLGKGEKAHQETRFKRVAAMVHDHVATVRTKEALAGEEKSSITAEDVAAARRARIDDAERASMGSGNKVAPDPTSPGGDSVKPASDGDLQPARGVDVSAGGDDDADGSEAVELRWPSEGGVAGQVAYVFMLPLMCLLYFTVPDVRRSPKWREWYPVTFVMSILWIGCFSFFMVWFAITIGETAGIPDPVMGLTFLAAGTSIPDLLSSVIVARQGLGDMAVSSSIGSNIFDVLVGLPLPWFFATAVRGEPIAVGTKGLKFSVVVLFAMLIFVVLIIKLSNWKMTKGLGYSMFALYVVFVALNLLVEEGVIESF